MNSDKPETPEQIRLRTGGYPSSWEQEAKAAKNLSGGESEQHLRCPLDTENEAVISSPPTQSDPLAELKWTADDVYLMSRNEVVAKRHNAAIDAAARTSQEYWLDQEARVFALIEELKITEPEGSILSRVASLCSYIRMRKSNDWVSVKDRLPTEEDGYGDSNEVETWYMGLLEIHRAEHVSAFLEKYSHWRTITPPKP